MTNEQINRAIAKAHLEERYPKGYWVRDYCNDLNAMHEAEKVLTDDQCVFFRTHLRERLEDYPASLYVWHANARQRAEAFLRTLGKWEEVQP